ncbi:hypothetical protein HY408_01590, partial [Candidatus Gottesmanbacteria bacterium]|nr:hypothetical protein [Candidatus Gottesmanbacteria bacterium]
GWDWLPHFDLIKDNWKANIEAGLFIIHYLLRKFPPQNVNDREWIGWFAEVFGQQRSEFVGQVHALFNTRFYDGRYPHLLDLPPTWVVTQRNHHETRTDQPGWAWDRGYCGNPKTRHGILIYAPMDCEVTDIWRYPQSKTTVMELTSPEGIHAHYLHQTGFVEGDPPYYQFTVRGQPKVIAIGTQLNKGEAMAQFGEEGYKPLRDNQGNIVYRLNELGERVPVMVSMGPHVHCEFWDPNNNPIDLSTITLPYYEQNGCGAYMWPSD